MSLEKIAEKIADVLRELGILPGRAPTLVPIPVRAAPHPRR